MHKTIKLGRGSTNSAKKFWLSDSSAYSIQSFVSSRRSFVSRRPQNINFGPGKYKIFIIDIDAFYLQAGQQIIKTIRSLFA